MAACSALSASHMPAHRQPLTDRGKPISKRQLPKSRAGRAFSRLDAPCREKILEQARQTDRACPLLVDHVCMVYEARPIICRTHGYPLYMEKEGRAMVDFCPKNFKGVKKLDRADMLDLDRMNTLLTAVNNHFIACFEDGLPDRIPVDQALELYQLL